MAYIPSRRVLKEGGYEGGGAMVYYGLPSPWSAEVEELIVKEVHRLAGKHSLDVRQHAHSNAMRSSHAPPTRRPCVNAIDPP